MCVLKRKSQQKNMKSCGMLRRSAPREEDRDGQQGAIVLQGARFPKFLWKTAKVPKEFQGFFLSEPRVYIHVLNHILNHYHSVFAEETTDFLASMKSFRFISSSLKLT